jgi:hypothetical protein
MFHLEKSGYPGPLYGINQGKNIRFDKTRVDISKFNERRYFSRYLVNMLKRQNILSMPKCHKIIKTTNSIYLVYD